MTTSTPNQEAEGIRLTRDEDEHLHWPDPVRLVADLSLSWVQAILGCALFVAYPAVWTWLIAVVLVAGAQHGLSMISHEAAHHLVWPRDHEINDRIGAYLFAAPVLLPFHVYRHRHLVHHRLVSRSDDTKTLYRRDLRGWRFAVEVLRSLIGLDYVLQAIAAIRHGQGEESAQFATRLRRDQRAIVAIHAILFLAFLAVDPLQFGVPTYYFILWLGPLLTLSFLFGKLRSIAEHQPPPTRDGSTPPTEYFRNTPGPMLRSVRANWFERLFLSKINFHFHAEHHLWPWISYQYLPEVSSRLWRGETGSRVMKGNLVSIENSYSRFLIDALFGR